MADHPRASSARSRLSPDAAYARWMDVCTDAGWRCVPAVEQIPVRDGLGRVTAATIQALWPAPRAACTAMDGIRPGHPVLLGYAMPRRTSADRPVAPVPVIGVPGYPLAAVVSFELFAVPLLAALQGREPADRARRRVQLGCDWTSPPHVEEWVPVSLTAPSGPHDSTAVVATPIKGGAGAISRLARADAWWPIPIEQEKFERGAHIDVQPISPDLLLSGPEPARQAANTA